MAHTTMMTLHPAGELLNDRYRILKPLGRGGLGFTYAAQDLQTDQSVALKVLSLRRAADWKKLELFEREAKVLAELNHPSIPRYIDYFQVDSDQDRSFYIAQQLAPGQSLEQWIEAGWRPSEEEVELLATQLLDVLVYLQTLLPPVFHRDIKPQNIIRHENGQLFLVDFGSVQDTYRQSITQGSTVVGTFGYMAPEQFRGEAVRGTDLYGLGATLLFLLTGDSPAELPQHQLKLDFRAALPGLDSFFADWLDRLLEPRVSHRFATAQVALEALHQRQLLAPPPPKTLVKPLGSPIQVSQSDDLLTIKIPPVGFRTPQIQRLAIANLIWNGLILFIVVMIVSLQLFLAPAKFLSFMVLVAIGLFLLVKYIYAALTVTHVDVILGQQMIQMRKVLLDSAYEKMRSPYALDQPKSTPPTTLKTHWWWPWRQAPLTYCSIVLRGKRCKFGGFLTQQETQWLTQEINDFMGR